MHWSVLFRQFFRNCHVKFFGIQGGFDIPFWFLKCQLYRREFFGWLGYHWVITGGPTRFSFPWGDEKKHRQKTSSFHHKNAFWNATSVVLHPTWHFQISLGLVARLAITWFVWIVLWTWRKWSWAYLLLRWKEACAFLVRFLEPTLPILTCMEAIGAGERARDGMTGMGWDCGTFS